MLILAISQVHSCNCSGPLYIFNTPSTEHCTCFVFLLQRGWQGFLCTRCQNTNRKPTASVSSEPQAKRPRPELQKHFYPSIGSSEEDKQSFERNKNLLLREMESKKPNPEAVKSLMVRTFAERRKNILSGGQMVAALCTEYPFLKKAMYVSCFCIGPVASLQSRLPVRCLGKWTVLCRRRTLLRISFYRGHSTRLP